MAVDEPSVIDFVAQSKTGEVILVISDHLDWYESRDHREILQAKLNHYLHFIESGQLANKFPVAESNPYYVEIHFEYEPDEEGVALIANWRVEFERVGSFLTSRFRQPK